MPLRRYKSYKFVPMDEWPGEDLTEDDVWLAALDERDWFDFPRRLQAHHDYRNRLDMGWYRRQRGIWGRKRPPPRFDFAQIGVVGDMGAGKTTIVGSEIEHYGQFGHPAFHLYNPDNGRPSWTVGKKIHPADLYEVIEVLPMGSILAVDEGHTFFDSRMAGTSGIGAWQQHSAGLRKALCRIYIPTAMMVLLAPNVRESCSEVWQPLKVEVDDHRLPDEKPPPQSDPKNFLQVWHCWFGHPFRRADIINGRNRVKRGLGPPHDTQVRQGAAVREGFKITDTFLRVAGAQAQQYARKSQQEEARERRRGEQDDVSTLSPVQNSVLRSIWETCINGYSEDFTVGSIAFKAQVNQSAASQMVSAFLGDIPGVKKADGRYRCDRVMKVLPMKFNIPDDWGRAEEDYDDDC